jgi:hypothetical protein
MSQTRSLAEILSTVSPLSESAAYCGMDDRFGSNLPVPRQGREGPLSVGERLREGPQPTPISAFIAVVAKGICWNAVAVLQPSSE